MVIFIKFHPLISKLQIFKQLARLLKFFGKVSNVVFQKCKVDSSSKLYSTCIYYLALQQLLFNLDIIQLRNFCKYENALKSIGNYFCVIIVFDCMLSINLFIIETRTDMLVQIVLMPIILLLKLILNKWKRTYFP